MLREGLIFLSHSSIAQAVVTRTPLRAMADRFVPGETVDDLVRAIQEANAEGLTATANFLGESVHDERNARIAADTYFAILERIHAEDLKANISLKFTALGQDISEAFLAENLGRILERARQAGVFIRFDMESSAYTQRTLDAFEKLWAEGWRNIGVVLQSYLKRSARDVARMNELGARVRLCKGAYNEPPQVAFKDKRDVDRNFVVLMKALMSEGNYPALATHDERMIEATIAFHQEQGIPKERFEFQMLHGVRRDLQRQLVRDGFNVRVYIPFGSHWYPYLMRRLAERPANVLFMAGSVLKETPLGALWPKGRDGVAFAMTAHGAPRPPAAPEPFLRITEIFHSIQGESTWAGAPCTFVRVAGCPLRCVWCDTPYAFHGGKRMTLADVVARVRAFQTHSWRVTGGEPLAHPNAFALVRMLLDEGFTVLVETSGAFDVAPLDARAHKIMDLKCPGSGESARNLWANLDHLTGRDEVKFVVRDRADYEWTRAVVRERGLDQRVAQGTLRSLLVSPVWGEMALESLAGWILEDRLPVRLQVQLHKLIWGPERTGV